MIELANELSRYPNSRAFRFLEPNPFKSKDVRNIPSTYNLGLDILLSVFHSGQGENAEPANYFIHVVRRTHLLLRHPCFEERIAFSQIKTRKQFARISKLRKIVMSLQEVVSWCTVLLEERRVFSQPLLFFALLCWKDLNNRSSMPFNPLSSIRSFIAAVHPGRLQRVGHLTLFDNSAMLHPAINDFVLLSYLALPGRPIRTEDEVVARRNVGF
eukprot:scaffold6322_cov59-Cylindrotheca_fusiformis.AAC.8